jgi:hypothetical protein
MFTLAGCPEDSSKNKIQPSRTFAAPAKTIERAHQMSRPIGCNGNPYYFNTETKEWYYYTMDGTAVLSPNQPPCAGADLILNDKSKHVAESHSK